MTDIQEILLSSFTKILKVNLLTEEYEIINILENSSKPARTITRKFYIFSLDNIHPADRLEFVQFVDVYSTSMFFEIQKNADRRSCYYRKKIDGEYRWCIAEVIKYGEFTTDHQEVIFTARLAGDDPAINEALAKIKNRLQPASAFSKKIEDYHAEFPGSLGMIIIKTEDKNIEEALKANFSTKHCYRHRDPNTYIIFLENMMPEEFDRGLLQLFETLENNLEKEYAIGTCWCRDEDLGIDYVLKNAFEKVERRLK